MLRNRQLLKIIQRISPQQIQFIKLLQIPTASLETRIKEELEENPALGEGKQELGENMGSNDPYADTDSSSGDQYEGDSGDSGDSDFNLDEYLASESYNYKTQLPSGGDDEEDFETPIVSMKSFYDNLQEQLGLIDLEEKEMIIAEHLIGSIDEDGYLRRPLPAIVNDMVFRYNVRTTPEEIEPVLKKIQKFDPPGIGARDLRESLMLQLERKEQTEEIQLAYQIVDKYFDEFSKKHFKRLRSALNLSEEELKEVYTEITRLNPKPGESQTVIKHEYIIPDFILTTENGKIDIKLNSRNAPELRVNGSYLKMYQQYKQEQKEKKSPQTKKTLDFVKSKIESAQWFIDAIRQRQITLLNTMMAIAEKQEAFFLSGGDEKKLKPMILKDIADKIKMDISTVSRVANSKYVQTEWSIYPLKYFFTEGIATESGEEVSNREVKRILQELVDQEDKKKPLSDDKLSEHLKGKGYAIARRTVAKYREQLNIPVARLRKEV